MLLSTSGEPLWSMEWVLRCRTPAQRREKHREFEPTGHLRQTKGLSRPLYSIMNLPLVSISPRCAVPTAGFWSADTPEITGGLLEPSVALPSRLGPGCLCCGCCGCCCCCILICEGFFHYYLKNWTTAAIAGPFTPASQPRLLPATPGDAGGSPGIRSSTIPNWHRPWSVFD